MVRHDGGDEMCYEVYVMFVVNGERIIVADQVIQHSDALWVSAMN